jgi:two-component system response regulator HydG
MADTLPVLLIVDDDPTIVALVEFFAREHGFTVVGRTESHRILTDLPNIKADVALVDLRMPGAGGLDLLRAIHDAKAPCSVILMTAYATVESAIEAMKLGALDYLTKPLDFDRLGELLATVRHRIERRQILLTADSELARRFEFYGMIGRSPLMQELFDTIRRLAPHARSALVTGETGTGKELVARALHKLGPRRDRPFIAFNCSAVVETLFESELFGHTRGAFTGAVEAKAGLFEMANGGTLFLDEVGELPLPAQAKLLRVVEDGQVYRVGASEGRHVDVRTIAATNCHLADEVSSGRFRQDLYYRLNVIEISVPPLRDRRDDISYLAAAFIKEFATRFSKPLGGLSLGAERFLHEASWPGNIRELRNVIERACMLSEGRILSEREVLSALGGGMAHAGRGYPASPVRDSEMAPAPELHRRTIQHALQQVGGNRSAAARLLGINRRALYRRLKAFGLA